MTRLAGPVGASRSGWGAAIGLGVGALLPAALAPGATPPAGAKPVRLAQDAVATRGLGLGGVAVGRGRLRPASWPLEGGDAAFTAPPRPAPPVERPAPLVDPGPCGEFGWFSPAPGAAVSQVFGVPDSEYAAGYHTGVDFAVYTGTPLLAVADAVVEVAGWGGAYGNWIVLRLPDGHFALYAHMSRLEVHTGDHVPAGGRLGLSGESGNARGPHLHFEIRTENRYGAVIDPLPYLRAHQCHL